LPDGHVHDERGIVGSSYVARRVNLSTSEKVRHCYQTSPEAKYDRLVLDNERQVLDMMAGRLLTLTNNYRNRLRSERRINMPKASTPQRYYTLEESIR
jgi:hypothetical protein